MLSLTLDVVYLGLTTSKWILSKTYCGANYLIYGSPEDPVLCKLEQLENQLNQIQSKKSKNQKFYWENKYQYNNYDWIIISQQKLIFQSNHKGEALTVLAEKSKKNENQKYLLIQVGNEINMCEI